MGKRGSDLPFFFCLISVFSGNDFPSVEVGLSFRKEQRSAVG